MNKENSINKNSFRMAYQLYALDKKNFMRKDLKGQPSGSNKSEGTGLSTDMQNQDLKKDEEMTEKYIAKPDKVADDVHVRHHNRNTSKENSTNAGGYKD